MLDIVPIKDTLEHLESSLGFDATREITATDEQIREYLQDAELPALLACLAMITGDTQVISRDLRPPMPPMGASIAPQGGMSAESQHKARQIAASVLINYRNNGCRVFSPSDKFLQQVIRFLTNDAGDEYMPLLRHELGFPEDLGAPTWRKADLAPSRDFRVAVIGAGLSGVAAAHRLKQAGVPFVVFDKNPDVGGVWWANTYPGCRLDTPNFAYSFSFAQKGDWPHQFSERADIQQYISRVADVTKIRENIRFRTEVISMTFSDETACWTLETRSEDGTTEQHMFHAIITAVGQLSRPAIPQLPGHDRFGGQAYHSATWPSGVDLKGKRVAVIGTGASAYQIVPSIVDEVSGLSVVQRSPPWMLPTPTYHDAIKPGMAWLLKHVPYYGKWLRFWQFWIAVEGRLPLVEVEPGWDHPVSVGAANERLRAECMAHLEAQLSDRPDLLQKMTPAYPPGSKRLLRDNGVWAKALKRPHVDLITETIDHLDETGIVFSDGSRADVDVIIYATGFQASDYLAPIAVKGVGGRDLHNWWDGDCRAYLGITIPGFPNLFMTAGPNTGVVINGSAIFSAECAVEYALSAIEELLANQIDAIDCRQEPFDEFNKRIDQENEKKAWGIARTRSWYKNSKGRASQTWPLSLLEYWQITRAANLCDYLAIRRSA
ncbi:MAG TPA: NAD(P)/FAD-dependent oxidoreductase [Bradyrhizobium sp.]|nr:NAD(P)/FAD-dependent oxidoreductase [Bradyrhizobium sp.]